jgi:hypothetical protein
MTLFNYISENLDTIKKEIRIGLISSSTLKHWQMYARYDYYKRIGNKTTDALDFACIDCGITNRSWGWVIKKRMENEL